jgi:hypothetical protein
VTRFGDELKGEPPPAKAEAEKAGKAGSGRRKRRPGSRRRTSAAAGNGAEKSAPEAPADAPEA